MQNDILKIWTVSHGLRKVGRIESVSKDEKNHLVGVLKSVGLGYLSFPSNTVTGDFHIIFSYSEDILKSIVAQQLNHVSHTILQDIQLGILYGYPKCCIKKFEEQQHSVSDDKAELDYTIDNSQYSSYPFYMNNTNGYRLYFHIACSLDCQYTQLLAQQHLFILKKYSEEQDFFEYIKHLKNSYYMGEKKIDFI